MLFEPIAVGGIILKNRICMPAIHHGYTPGGLVNERLIKYYETRARGGAALIVIGGCTIDTAGGNHNMIGLHDDRYIDGLSRLTAAVKSAGALVVAQLFQAGRYAHSALTGQQPLAPSAIPSRLTREMPREMTGEEIGGVIESFAAAALRAKQAGFDAVEIMASAGYLICQFLSPLTNQRADRYGGSWENRCRFALESVAAIRDRVGKNFPLLARISGNDFIPGSCTNSEAAAFARELAAAGVDCLSVTGGWHESRVPQITGDLPRGGFAHLAYGVREAVGVPVIASNRINDPLVAEQILKSGQADMVNLGRQLIADPDFPVKAAAGRHHSIRRCVACNQGCLDMVFSQKDVYCAINPLAGREAEITLLAAPSSRSILVVGGGPAGMEAAVTAADRGHRVTLWEQSPRLGGQLNYAAIPPGKQEFSALVDYYRQRLDQCGVEVVLNRKATAESVINAGPDLVILATGARPAAAPFTVDGEARKKVIGALEALSGEAPVGKNVVVIGGGAVGCETAITIASLGTLDAETLRFLLENGAASLETLTGLAGSGSKKVTLIEMLKGIGNDIGITTRWVALQKMRRLGVRVLDEARVISVSSPGVTVEQNGKEKLIPADTVVIAAGSLAADELAAELKGKLNELYIIGDAASPRKMSEAIREGFDLARRL